MKRRRAASAAIVLVTIIALVGGIVRNVVTGPPELQVSETIPATDISAECAFTPSALHVLGAIDEILVRRRSTLWKNGVPRGNDAIVRGWVALGSPPQPASSILVVIGDRCVDGRRPDLPRPDVGEALHAPALTRSGFAIPLSAGETSAGSTVALWVADPLTKRRVLLQAPATLVAQPR